MNAQTKRQYRGVNFTLLSLEADSHGYAVNRWLTYRQASELGGQVRRGERGTTVVFWQLRKIAVTAECYPDSITPDLPDRAVLRRGLRTPESDATIVRLGEVSVDLPNRRVMRGDEGIRFTPIEFRLLSCLLAHPGKVLTHRQLLREVWGPSHAEDSHYLRIYMAHLRRKLEAEPARPRYLITEPGVGYRFVP